MPFTSAPIVQALFPVKNYKFVENEVNILRHCIISAAAKKDLEVVDLISTN
jgi:hypothetical protein